MWWFMGLLVAAGLWYWWSQATKPSEAPQAPPEPVRPQNDWLSQYTKQAAAEAEAKARRDIAETIQAARRNQAKH